jgi:hypothetical protein
MKAIDRFKKIQKLNEKTKSPPWNVGRCFEGEFLRTFGIQVCGDQICLGEDYVSLSEAREAVEWLASELGGEVEWE